MRADDLVERLKDDVLNRPDDDGLYDFPDAYYNALSKAQRYFYRQAVTHYPELFRMLAGPIPTSDDGETYPLTDDHYGEMEVWTPPGPPNGQILTPAEPEAQRLGFYVQGRELKLTFKRVYTPGIYVRWTPATLTDIDADNDPLLPAYFEDALVFRAAFYMASKPGFLGDPSYFNHQAIAEWEGDENSPSDAGILGVLSRQSAHGGYKTLGDSAGPWYKRIPKPDVD